MGRANQVGETCCTPSTNRRWRASWGFLSVGLLLILLFTLPRLPRQDNPGSRPSPAPGSKCVPVDKIGFAKTHKTASSTVQNIFLRWGLNQGWNFALLSSGSHLGPPNNQYVLNKPFQVLLLCVFRFLSCFPPGLLVTRSALG